MATIRQILADYSKEKENDLASTFDYEDFQRYTGIDVDEKDVSTEDVPLLIKEWKNVRDDFSSAEEENINLLERIEELEKNKDTADSISFEKMALMLIVLLFGIGGFLSHLSSKDSSNDTIATRR